jgi:nicotinamidase-related amidase
MKRIGDKMVCETLEEIVDPTHTALLIIDIQNDHGAKGFLAKSGRNVSWVLDMLPTVKKVLARARERGMLVVFTSNTISKGLRMESPAQIRHLSKATHIPDLQGYELEHSWGNAVLDELERRPEEPWIAKYRSSAFHGTQLDLLLRNHGISSTVIMGLVTEGCVESTVRDVLGHGYYPVLLRDCITSSRRDLHDAAMTVMSARYDVVDADEVLAIWG